MSRVSTFTGRGAHIPFTTSILQVMILLSILLAAVSALAGPPMRGGVVAAKGVVLQDGNPVWVEYGEDGRVVAKIDVPADKVNTLEAISRQEYLDLTKLDKDWNTDPRIENDPEIQSVLLDRGAREIFHVSENNIGYWAAFYTEEGQKPEEYNPGLRSLYGFERRYDLWGPISGVKISAGAGGVNWAGDITDTDGAFTVGIPNMYPSCLPYAEMRTLLATFRFTKFDPDHPTGVYYLTRETSVTGGGDVFVCSALLGPSLIGQATAMSIGSIAATMPVNTSLVNFAVDVAIMSGTGSMTNEIPLYGEGVQADVFISETVARAGSGGRTEYGYYKPGFIYQEPTKAPDINQDGADDLYQFNAETGEIQVWFSSEMSGEPDFTYYADTVPDFEHHGLVRQITEDDLQNTDLYVFRLSNGQLLMERDGLRPSETNWYYGGGAYDGETALHYRMMMRGPASFHSLGTREEEINQWQAAVGMDEALRGIKSDTLRPGELIKVILVNRATGYIGSAITTMGLDGTNKGIGTGTSISVTVPPITMRPPNLRVRVERKRSIETGATSLNDDDLENKHLIGFEGSGLTSDEYIKITTEWTDYEGKPLPEALKGYTGRLAKVVEENELHSANFLANFEVEPGQHMKLVRLPQAALDKVHYYVHINGEKPTDNPDFETLGGVEAGELLRYRPKHYVPFMVPLYDKAAHEAELKKDWDAKPIYKWVYRPEMQFSLFDLDVSNIEQSHTEGSSTNITDADIYTINPRRDTGISLLYTLLESDLPMLEQFGPDRVLLFSLGDYEIKATTGEDNALVFANLDKVKLDALSTEDFVGLRLFQNGDDANVLWEHAALAVKKVLIDRQLPIPIGVTAQLSSKTVPKGYEPQVRYRKLTEKDVPPGEEVSCEGVKFSITSKGAIQVHEDSMPGWARIRAYIQGHPEAYKDVSIEIGCPNCEEGNCTANTTHKVELDSVNFSLGLGPAPAGEKSRPGIEAGRIFLRTSELSSETYTPAALEFSSFAEGVREIYDNAGALRRVVAPLTTADIVTVNDFGYEIRLYDTETVGAPNSLSEAISAAPVAVWTIANPDASPDIAERLRITQTKDGAVTNRYEYAWDAAAEAWSLSKGDGLSIETKQETTDVAGDRVVIETVEDASGTVASFTRTTWHAFAWGEEMIKREVGTGDDVQTTLITYYDDPGAGDDYGHVKQRVQPDGSWTRYHYDGMDRVIQETRSWLDAPATSSPAAVRVTTYDYTPVDPDDAGDPEDVFQPRTVTETVNGTVVSKTYYGFRVSSDGERTRITEQCVTPGAAWGDAANLRTVTIYNRNWTGTAEAGQVKRVVHPDGRQDTYAYEFGFWSGGSFAIGAGKGIRQTVTHGTTDHPEGIARKTTRDVTIEDEYGRNVRQETYVYTGDAYELVKYTNYLHDEEGRVEATIGSDGSRTDTNWSCCAKESQISATGIETVYTYDDLKRPIAATKIGAAGQADITTGYVYDALGRRTTTTVSADTLSTTTTTEYDSAGRVVSQTDAQGLTTTYAYADGGRTTTVTRPGGATETTTRYLDGRVKSVTGTAVVPRYYTYGVNPDGTQWTQVTTGAPDAPAWERTTTDFAGRTVRTETPGPQGTVRVTQNFYNADGQLVKTTTTGSADVLYAYDDLGRQVRSGLDIDGNGALDPASSDRINETETAYVNDAGDWWQERRQYVYAAENDAVETLVGTQRTRMTGLGVNNKVSESVTIDIHGNTTRALSFVDRAAKQEIRLTTYPDSDTIAKTVAVNGMTVSSQSKTGITTTFAYDALERRTGVTDPRTGTAVTHYDENGRVDYVEDAAKNRTTFTYDPETGRKIAETNAAGNTTRYTYNDRGQVVRTWGDAAYPVEYVYDGHGRMKEMHTFRTEEGWDAATWPASASGDTTTWNYDPATGLLAGKQDALGNAVSYTYDAAGRLATRTWARTENNTPVVSTYAYDADTGDLTGIDYSDETPDIDFAYDRMGRKQTVTDATGTRTFAYNDALQLASETLFGIVNRTITRNYAESGVKGRAAGFGVGTDYAVNYGYDTKGRMYRVAWNAAGQADAATYGYLADSDLLESMSTTNGLITSYAYEPHRNVKTAVENAYNTTLVSRYAYTYDALGRRSDVKNTGLAFAADAFNTYDYNDRNELTQSSRYLGSDTEDTSLPVAPEYRAYDYDPIGNREEITKAADTGSYSTNALNQYLAQMVPSDGTRSFDYDADGNLVSLVENGSETVYDWNAENRLVEAAPATPAEGDTKVAFVYDYMGRRVQKTVYSYASGSWTIDSEFFFIYDGWNLVEEITIEDNTQTSRYFVWGLDLSQSLQGAGGIGGLIAAVDSSLTYYYCYDANGNVGQMIDAEDGTLVAAYEYDPYGNFIKAGGDHAEDNPFRFSTKYHDVETGLVYYGYRYYSSEMGRWLTRDLVGERASVNLFCFVNNNSIAFVDPFGLALYAFDGTGNNDREVKKGNYTNVYILNKGYRGNKIYIPGVGSRFLQRIVGGLTGGGGQARVEKAYKAFLDFYENGDEEVDIIGFSRGAALAREFANVLNDRGYRKHYGTILEYFNNKCPVKIRFVGLFDTVGSFGIPGNMINIGIRMDLPPNVENVAQAVAEDEKRYLFPLTPLNPAGPNQNFIEKRFAGDHSDIGRGHGNDTNDLSRAPLEFIWGAGRSVGVPFGSLSPFIPTGNTTPHDLSEEFPHTLFPKRYR